MKIKIAIVGLGYWGPNFIRNFIRHEKTDVAWICDISPTALDKMHTFYPHIKQTSKFSDILNDQSVDLVMIVTPPESHYKLVKSALENNKHVVVAKPMTTNSRKALELLRLAQKKKLLLYGDLTYLHTGAVKYVKKLLQKGEIGSPLYYDSTRSNLGLIQKDVNVIWDLAPHDFAIIDHCFGLEPRKIFASGSKHYGKGNNEEMAHITITYENNFIAHIHVSWLSPIKLRTILIGGTKKMVMYNDVEPDEKVKLYDKGVEIASEDITYMKPVYRTGNAIIPKLQNEEAIFIEINDIIKNLSQRPISYPNAELNIKIIKMLEACDKSLRTGKPVIL
jgi:predicted dehydrogenase